MKTLKKIYKIQRKIDNYFQRILRSKSTHNMALSLCKVLDITLYFSEGFSKVASRGLVVVKALQLLKVIVVCFLGQESNLWFPALQQRYRLFLRYFLHSPLINLLILTSLKERFTYGELNCFLEVENRDGLKEDVLADKATRDRFVLFWRAVALPEVKAFSCFQK